MLWYYYQVGLSTKQAKLYIELEKIGMNISMAYLNGKKKRPSIMITFNDIGLIKLYFDARTVCNSIFYRRNRLNRFRDLAYD
jgi:hypothetical protein